MKRIELDVERCADCPYAHHFGWAGSTGTLFKCRNMKASKYKRGQDIAENNGIPKWCPLSDAEETE